VTLQDAWTEDELQANRRGELAPSQIAKIRSRWRAIFAASAAVGVAICGPAGYLIGPRLYPAPGILYVGVAVVAVIGTVILIARRAGASVRGDRVVTMTGHLSVSFVGNQRLYMIEGQTVQPLYAGLERVAGQTVTAYLLPENQLVIAIERSSSLG
jgi:hypothetical protein